MADAKTLAHHARESFFVSEDDGLLRHARNAGRFGRIKAGAIAGTEHPRGYIAVKFDGRPVLAHRLVWLMIHGAWPIGEIDHIDGNKRNNRPSNLRDVSHAVNQQNRRNPQKNNATGMLGVIKQGKRYWSSVRFNGKTHFVGAFDTPEEAHRAYIERKRLLHEGCTL